MVKRLESDEIKVDKGVPVPKQRAKYRTYPWDALGIGDSFFVAGATQQQLGAAARTATLLDHRRSWKFATRKTTENGVAGVRLWRVE